MIDLSKGELTELCTKTSDCKNPRLTCVSYGIGRKLCIDCKTLTWTPPECALANPLRALPAPSNFPYWMLASQIVIFALVTAFVWIFDSWYPKYRMRKEYKDEKRKMEERKKQKEESGGGDGLSTPMPEAQIGPFFSDN